MKKILAAAWVFTAGVTVIFGQGRMLFNNYAAGSGAVIIAGNGQYVGADYSIALYWAPSGTYASLSFL